MIAESKRKNNAVVLFSGGLDSATVCAMAADNGYCVHALTIDYGQRHRVELERARRAARSLGVEKHHELRIGLGGFGGSALTDISIDVPANRPESQRVQGVPVTYVPARNLIFLSIAASLAETLQCQDIFIGVNIVDYSGYPDCRPAFIEAFEKTVNLGTKAGAEDGRPFRIHAPLSGMSKAEIIRTGLELGVDYGATHSCYNPTGDGSACGMCDSCLIRKRGFSEAGVDDPAKYAEAER